jgi:hypothetical protein
MIGLEHITQDFSQVEFGTNRDRNCNCSEMAGGNKVINKRVDFKKVRAIDPRAQHDPLNFAGVQVAWMQGNDIIRGSIERWSLLASWRPRP